MTEEFSFNTLEPEFSFDTTEQSDAGLPEFSFEALKTPEETIKEETGFVNEWIPCPLCKTGYLQKTPEKSLYTRHQGGAIKPEEAISDVLWLCTSTNCAYGETTKTEFKGVEE